MSGVSVAPDDGAARHPAPGAWASLPALRPSVGEVPLTAPSAEFAHEQVTNVAVQMALQPLGHDHSASGPAGLVSGAALPVISRSVAEPAAPATPGPVSDRPGALDRFAHRVLGSVGSRGRERSGISTGAFEPAGAAATTLADSAEDRFPAGAQAPASAAPAPDLPPPLVRAVPAVEGDAARAASLVHASDVAVGARHDGRLGRPTEGTAASDGEAARADVGPDANPGLRAAGPASDGGPEWAIQRAAPDAGRGGPPPVRLSVGQVRRLGLGAPMVSGAPPASAQGPDRFGSPMEDSTAASAGSVPHTPTMLRVPRVQRRTEGAGSHEPEDGLAGTDAAELWVGHDATGERVEAAARAGDGLASRSHLSTAQGPGGAPIDPVVTMPAVVGVPFPSPSPNQREGGDLRPLVGRRFLGRRPTGNPSISVSRLADADASSGGTTDGPPGGGFDYGAGPAFGALPDVTRWPVPDGDPTFSATTDVQSWPGVPGPPAGSARRLASAPQRGPSVFRASPTGAAPTPAGAALQRQSMPSGQEMPFPSPPGSATSPAAATIQRDPEPSQADDPATRAMPASFDADVVQRAIGGSAGGDGSGSLPTGDRELQLLAESLYERVRSHLRQELLVDRERSGILSNLS